jgi:hypothetical protein
MNLLFSFPQQPLSFVREGLRGEERSSWGEEKNYHEITKVRRRERYKFFFRVFVLSRFRDCFLKVSYRNGKRIYIARHSSNPNLKHKIINGYYNGYYNG